MAAKKTLEDAINEAGEAAKNAKMKAEQQAAREASDAREKAEAADRARRAEEHKQETHKRKLSTIEDIIIAKIDKAVALLNEQSLDPKPAPDFASETFEVDGRDVTAIAAVYYIYPPSFGDKNQREAHIYFGWSPVSESYDRDCGEVVVFGGVFSDGMSMTCFNRFGFSQCTENMVDEALTNAIERLNH